MLRPVLDARRHRYPITDPPAALGEHPCGVQLGSDVPAHLNPERVSRRRRLAALTGPWAPLGGFLHIPVVGTQIHHYREGARKNLPDDLPVRAIQLVAVPGVRAVD